MECSVASRRFRDVCPEIFAFFRDINVKPTKYHGLSNWENRGLIPKLRRNEFCMYMQNSLINPIDALSPKKVEEFHTRKSISVANTA